MAWRIYNASGFLKTSVSSVDVSNPAGVLPVANGGTGSATSIIDTDGTLAANSDALVASQKAVNTKLGNLTAYAKLAGGNIFTGAQDLNGATMRAPVSSSALTATEGYFQWNNTLKRVEWHDGTRTRSFGFGFQPYAMPMGWNSAMNGSSINALFQGSGTMLIPFLLVGSMAFTRVGMRENSTVNQRSWGWDLYADVDETSNTIPRIVSSNGVDTFTPSAQSARALDAATVVILPPGAYYLAIQNRHATNLLNVGVSAAAEAVLGNLHMLKTRATGGVNGATLNIVSFGGWAATNENPAVQMQSDAGNFLW